MNYALLLRGVNVGGAHKVKMADLADMLTGLGYTRVKTYIQSGNAVLQATVEEPELLQTVRDAFAQRFGFACDLVARNAQQLQAVKDGLPFRAEDIAACEAANPDTAHLYVYFLPAPPEPLVVKALQVVDWQGDQLAVAGREIYLLCRDSVRTSKLALALAKRLPQATARNWNTLCSLLAMLQA